MFQRRRSVCLLLVGLGVILASISVASRDGALSRSKSTSQVRDRLVAGDLHAGSSSATLRGFGDAAGHVSRRVGPTTIPSWTVGDVHRFQLRQTQELSLHANASAEAPASGCALGSPGPTLATATTTFEAALVVRVLRSDSTGILFALRIDEPRIGVMAEGRSGDDSASVLLTALDREIYARFGPLGKLDSLHLPEGLPASAKLRWRDVVTLLQVETPIEPSATDWTLEEEDGTGTYTAAYSVTEVGSFREVVRRKHGYSRLHGAAASGPITGTVEGEARYSLDPRVVRIAASETSIIRTGTVGIAVSSSSRAELVSIGVEHDELRDAGAEGQASDPVAGLVALRFADPVVQEGSSGAPPREGAAGAAATEIQELERLLSDGKARSQEEFARMASIVLLVQEHEEAVAVVTDRLRREPVTAELAAVLCGALGAAGTEACQRGLLESVSDLALSEERRTIALMSLAQVEVPIGEWDEALATIYDRGGALGSTALLLLGTIGDHVSQRDPSRFEAIRARLLAEASREGASAEHRVIALDALGNLPHPTVPVPVAAALTAADPALRAAAIRALARTRDTSARDALLAATSGDVDEAVRREAVRLLADSARPYGVEVLLSVATHDGSADVRMDAVSSLTLRLPEPAARAALQRLARETDSDDLRAATEQGLRRE